jgi:hypothetical protein
MGSSTASSLTQAQLQQVTDRVPYRDRQGMVPDLAFHGLGGTSAQYYELKGRLRASKNTYPRGPNTGVAKRAASVQVEHVRKVRKLDLKLYGTDIDSASAPGPLLMRFRALGEVHPIVFGDHSGPMGRSVQGWRSCLIGKLADAWAPQIADQYLLDNVLAAEGGHREEHPTSYGRKSERPASTRTRTSSLGARSSASQAAARRTGGAETKTSDSIFNRARARRNKRQEARGTGGQRWGHRAGRICIWWHAPSPVELLVGLAG